MDNGTIGMILSAIWGLLGLIGGGSFLMIIRKIIKAIRESTEVGAALDALIESIEQAEKDGIWETGEIELIKAKINYLKKQAREAKDAWGNIQKILLRKK